MRSESVSEAMDRAEPVVIKIRGKGFKISTEQGSIKFEPSREVKQKQDQERKWAKEKMGKKQSDIKW